LGTSLWISWGYLSHPEEINGVFSSAYKLRLFVAVLEAYRAHVAERAALGIPPLPLSKQQTTELVALLKNPPKGEEAALVELITYRVPAGVDDAAKVKAEFLAKVSQGRRKPAP
jgi:hypothetical protein